MVMALSPIDRQQKVQLLRRLNGSAGAQKSLLFRSSVRNERVNWDGSLTGSVGTADAAFEAIRYAKVPNNFRSASEESGESYKPVSEETHPVSKVLRT